jgi:hypothetical protein
VGNNLSDDFSQFLQVDNLVQQTAKKYNVDPDLVHRMITQESAYNPRAVSKVGAQGLMQLMPATAAGLGVKDSFDPAQNIEGGTKYLASLLQRYGGDTNKALAAYNAGPGNVDSGKAAGFKETQDYVRRINGGAAPSATDTPSLSSDFEAFLKSGQPQPEAAATPQPKGFFRRLAEHPLDTVADELPMVGGMVGGAFGPQGAAIGGAAGKGFRDLYNTASELPGAVKDIATNIRQGYGDATAKGAVAGAAEGAKDAALEGGKQLLYDVGGRIVAKPVTWAGKRLVQKAFNPSAKLLEKAPTLVDDLIEAGVNPTAAGAKTAKASMVEARQVADKLVTDAHATGVQGPTMREVLRALVKNPYGEKSVVEKINTLAEKTPSLQRVGEYIKHALADNPAQMTLPETLAMRRAEGNAAKRVFEGALPNPGLEAQLHAATEQGARHGIETRVPGWAEANDVTAKALNVATATAKAAQQRAANVGGVGRAFVISRRTPFSEASPPQRSVLWDFPRKFSSPKQR